MGYIPTSLQVLIEGHGNHEAFTSHDFLEHRYWEEDQFKTVATGCVLFQGDESPAHGIKSNENPCNLRKQEHGVEGLDWAASSPDTAAIEQVWQSTNERE